MNLKKLTIISVLITTNIITAISALIFYFGMIKNFEDLDQEETHYMEHMAFEKDKLKQFILNENKGLNKKQFKEKYGITSNPNNINKEESTIEHELLNFTFKNNVLNNVE